MATQRTDTSKIGAAIIIPLVILFGGTAALMAYVLIPYLTR
jgi:hypothetical protein